MIDYKGKKYIECRYSSLRYEEPIVVLYPVGHSVSAVSYIKSLGEYLVANHQDIGGKIYMRRDKDD